MKVLFSYSLMLFFSISLFSQSLNPDATVNTATGEMSFSLPLGVVNGVNGLNYPVNLNYKSGIMCTQDASAVGLGFSYGAGGITRKVTFIPDDNVGGSGNYVVYKLGVKCTTPGWMYFIQAVVLIIGVIISIYTAGASMAVAVAANLAMAGILAIPAVVSSVYFSPVNFIAGGSHTPVYNDAGHGTGYLRGGSATDLPDVYFISTPYISGEMVWLEENGTGRFVMRTVSSSNVIGKETIKIEHYDKEFTFFTGTADTITIQKMVFKITLSDGTMLIFDEIDAASDSCHNWMNKRFRGSGCNDDDACDVSYGKVTNELTTLQWHLTAVLKPDYIDGSVVADIDPLNSIAQNTGSWLAFQYNKMEFPDRYEARGGKQTGPYTQGWYYLGTGCGTSGKGVRINFLNNVITPNETADFIYVTPYDRIDKKWFNKDGSGEYVLEPRLSEIRFNAKGAVKKRINFKQDFHIRIISCNPPVPYGALSLNSVTVWDAALTKQLPPIEFGYENNPTLDKSCVAGEYDKRLIEGTISSAVQPYCLMSTFSDFRDLWGYYYCTNVSPPFERFNEIGEKWHSEPDAWSLTSIRMPEGMTIDWEYESHRYDRVNGAEVHWDTTSPKYGGGTRVKKMTANNDMGKSYTRSFFYTDSVGCFVENNNSAGYASVEPVAFHKELANDYRTELRTRGGLYTPAVVAYEMVQVANNYIEPDSTHNNGIAPYGYTVYKYTHCGDSTDTANYQPNHGRYGEYDYQWRRGYLVLSEVYDKDGKMLSSTKNTYVFHNTEKLYRRHDGILGTSIFSPYYSDQAVHICGWVELKKTETTRSGVVSSRKNYYATDLTTIPSDKLLCLKKRIMMYDADSAVSSSPNPPEMFMSSRVAVCRTKRFGSDSTKDDYILVKTDYGGAPLTFCIGKDVGSYPSSNQARGTWTEWYEQFENYSQECYLAGINLFDMDNDGNVNDLVVVTSSPNLIYYLYVYVFHDIAISGAQIIVNGGVTASYVFLQNKSSEFMQNQKNHPSGCTVGDFYGDQDKPDFLIFPTLPYPSFEGDCPTSDTRRYIYAIIDFEETAAPPTGVVNCSLWCSLNDHIYFGHASFFTDADGGGTQNDLVIVGPGKLDNGPLYENDFRPFAYQIFNNISFNNYQILFSDTVNPCSNCGSKEYELFNDQPLENLGGWSQTKFAGVYHDELYKHEKFFFFFHDDQNDNSHFYVMDCIPDSFIVDYDGQPNRTCTQNSDGTYLLSTTMPAYYRSPYAAMGAPGTQNNKNMLAQQCGSVTYKFSSGTSDTLLKGALSGHAYMVVSAKATTWNEFNATWLPKASYAWRVPMDTAGLPVIAYTPFNYSLPTLSDTSWRLTDSICKYTWNNLPKETAKPLLGTTRLNSSTIYGYNGTLPIATVTNAQWEECGVFTGDYQSGMGHTGYWDYENGWEKGVAEQGRPDPILADNVTHFGQQVLAVTDNYAAGRNNRIFAGKSYVMKAWVKVNSGRLYMVAHYYSRSPGGSWPADTMDPENTFSIDSVSMTADQCAGKWKLMQLTIPASKTAGMADIGKEYLARTWIGNHGDFNDTSGVHAYIDDIRFAPSDAFVSTTYYDHTWQLPIVNVCANNKPGRKITYDNFGRPIKWDKIDPSKSVGESDYATTVQRKTYHIRNELPDGKHIQVLYPDGGENYTSALSIPIRWVNDGTRDVDLYYKLKSGDIWGSWTQIGTTLTGQSGWCVYDWTVPAGTANDCLIKAEIAGVESDESDRSFYVSRP